MMEHVQNTEERYRRSGWRGPVFESRTDAARQLVERLEEQRVRPDVVVALSPDGAVVGRTIAEAFGIRLEHLVVRSVFPPGDAEVVIAGVSDGGALWLDESLVPGFEIVDEYLERELRREYAQARVLADRHHGQRPSTQLDDLSILLATDGIEHRAPVIAAVQQLRRDGAGRITVGTPVVAPDCEQRVAEAASDVVCVERPRHFERLEQFYQSSDDDSDTSEPRRRQATVSTD